MAGLIYQLTYFFGLIVATWLFVEGAAPIQFIKKLLNLHPASKTENNIRLVIIKLLSCAKCSGFWFGLIYYQDFLLACITSLCAEIFHRLVNRFL